MNKATATFHHQYRQLWWRRITLLLILMCALIGSLCYDIAVGSSSLSLSEVIHTILKSGQADLASKVIVWDIRLPYSVMAVLVGACLSVAGNEMQTIMNNSMASPFTLGISTAASFGAALAIILGVSSPGVDAEWMIVVNAFLFAFGAVLLLQSLSGLIGAGSDNLVLFGIALVFTFNALIGIMQYVASAEALQQFVFWTLGSLTKSNWSNILVLGLIFLLVVPFSLRASWRLNALRMGDDSAESIGISVKRFRLFSLLRISILTAASVAFVGVIGFIGLVGPHIAKLLIGEDHRFSLPASILSGALIMSLASILSKSVVDGAIIPVGIVTSLIGVPVFVGLIIMRNRR